MTECDTADSLLFDDDGEDCDVGQDEEAELLREDDDDEVQLDYQVDPLDEEEEEDSHRDKFASERSHQIAVNESTHNKSFNRDNYHQRFNRPIHGSGRPRGRGGYNNGPLRKGDGKCFVNPSFLQSVKKPVQSVQPLLNPPRNYEPARMTTPSGMPFTGQRFQHQQHQQMQNQHQPQYNSSMQMNQSYGQHGNHQNWQGSQQPNHLPVQQNYYNTPAPPQQQCYQPPMQQNPQQYPPQQQYPNQQPLQYYDGPQNQNFYPNRTNTPNFSSDPYYNDQYQAPPAQYQPPQSPNMHTQLNHAPQYNRQLQPPPPQHAPHQMQHSQQQLMQQNSYYDPHQQFNQNMNQNYPQVHHNPQNHGHAHGSEHGPGHAQSFNPPPQRHSGPLLQRPPYPPIQNVGSYHPRPRFHQSRPFFSSQRQIYPNQNTQFRPRTHMQPRPTFRPHFGHSHRGGYEGGHHTSINNRLGALKRRNENWHGDRAEEECPKRKSWGNYNEQYEHDQEHYDDYESYHEYNRNDARHEDKDEKVEARREDFKVTIVNDPAPAPDVDEDDETKAYRIKIEEQKRKREEFLAEKERKRKMEIMKKTGEVCDIPALQATAPAAPQRPKMVAPRLTSKTNPNLRLLTHTDMGDGDSGAAGKAGANTNAGIDKPTSGFLSSRKVIAKDESLLDTKVVVVSNLASSSEPQLRKMCHGVGLVQSLEMSSKERQAKILFKSVASAHTFYKKYQRHMLDLSMIQVELVSDAITE